MYFWRRPTTTSVQINRFGLPMPTATDSCDLVLVHSYAHKEGNDFLTWKKLRTTHCVDPRRDTTCVVQEREIVLHFYWLLKSTLWRSASRFWGILVSQTSSLIVLTKQVLFAFGLRHWHDCPNLKKAYNFHVPSFYSRSHCRVLLLHLRVHWWTIVTLTWLVDKINLFSAFLA